MLDNYAGTKVVFVFQQENFRKKSYVPNLSGKIHV